jgi:hypothetical protein
MSESVCHKCGAVKLLYDSPSTFYECNSALLVDGRIDQSDGCRIRELTNTVAQQAEEIVRLKEERDECLKYMKHAGSGWYFNSHIISHDLRLKPLEVIRKALNPSTPGSAGKE